MPSRYGKAPRFIPQRMNRVFVYAGYGVARAFAHSRYKVKFEISCDDLARLKEISNSRSIILPNHPAPADWLIMYLLSAKLLRPFHYMTAHEQFFASKQSWLPRFGAYSIRRGGWGDVSSVVETIRILERPRCGLVIFPEGRCTFSSRKVFEFKTGAVKIGFNYLLRLGKLQEQDLFLVPVAIRYQLVESIEGRVEERIERLQHRLSTTTTGTPCNRIRELAHYIVANLEDQYGLREPASEASWQYRIIGLCHEILRLSEQLFGISESPRKGIINRACNIRQVLAVRGHSNGIVSRSIYEQAYYPTLLVLVLESFGELDLSEQLSTSGQIDLLQSLERIVYKIPDPLPLGRRQAVVRVGEKINLASCLADYCADRKRTITNIVCTLRTRVEHNLSITDDVDGLTAHGAIPVKKSTTREQPIDPVSRG